MSAGQGRLSDVEQQRLLLAARQGDLNARERLVSANLPLVHSIARRFSVTGREEEDLFQVGCIGLLKAIERFDPSRGFCFSTYCVPLIMGEIRRHLRDYSALKISRQLRERAMRIERCRREFYQSQGREPDLSQVAQACGLDMEQVVAALEAARPPLSISEPRFTPSGDAVELGETISDDRQQIGDELFDRLALLKAMESLPERLAYVLRCRYFGEMTQTELSAEMGISQVQVSRLEKKAMELIRRQLQDKTWDKQDT